MAVKFYDPRTWFRSTPQRVDPLANIRYVNVTSVPFNGEKNPGGAGPIINYTADHQRLAIRSWQALYESDLAQIAIKRLITWMIGKGLKLQAEPNMKTLERAGIKFDKDAFVSAVESSFNQWRKSKECSFSGMQTLNQLSREAEKNSLVAGDILVVLRVVKGRVKVQHIDALNVCSPEYGTEFWPKELANGNLIIDGVEINSRREHVAYWVRTYALEATGDALRQNYRFERVAAKNSRGFTMAYLYRQDPHKVNDVRGPALLTACFEKLNNLGQYSDATLQQAKEAAKVDYVQETDIGGIGDAVWAKGAVLSTNGRGPGVKNPVTDDGTEKLRTVNVTGLGEVYNMPPGSKMKVLENKNPLYFKDFFTVHSGVFFAVVEIPPEVAMSAYTNNFSASRMASGDWFQTLIVKRDNHHEGYEQPIVDLWLHQEIMTGRLSVPGYQIAYYNDNTEVLAAFRNVRFIGANVPAVDPLKEANAARVILGSAGEHLPMGELESITEQLGNGDSKENIAQFGLELVAADKAGIKPQIAADPNKTKDRKSQD